MDLTVQKGPTIRPLHGSDRPKGTDDPPPACLGVIFLPLKLCVSSGDSCQKIHVGSHGRSDVLSGQETGSMGLWIGPRKGSACVRSRKARLIQLQVQRP